MRVQSRWFSFFYGIVAASFFIPSLPADTVSSPSPPHLKHELYFSPEDAVDAKLISFIENEKEEVRAAIYCLTHRGIIKALIDARERGVNVEIIVDPFSIKARSPLKRIAQSGVSLYVWDPKSKAHSTEDDLKQRSPLMHNKFCVFGKSTVWTGSFNFTSEASLANRENVVVLHDPLAARRYLEEFERLKNEGCAPYRVYLSNQALKKAKKTHKNKNMNL